MPSFSAVLLAGGRSSRMGRDKAMLALERTGELLWQRQIATLLGLEPEMLFWSGPPRPGLSQGIRLVADNRDESGPLAGISACLNLVSTDLLVVLAIDLPAMDSSYLKSLLSHAQKGCGVVPQLDGCLEPLAAVYPRTAADLATEFLNSGRHRMQDFVREAHDRSLLEIVAVGDGDAARFANINSPNDLADYSK